MKSIPGVVVKTENEDFGIFKINGQPGGFKFEGRPAFSPYFKTANDQLPHIEELMDQPHRIYYRSYTDSDTTQQRNSTIVAESTEETEELEDFDPKSMAIFDTSLFKSGLRFREAINERVVINNDASRGLVSYTDYLRGAESIPK